jgi:hypothetical protein
MVEILTTTKTVLPPSLHPDTCEPYRWLTHVTLYTRRARDLVPLTAEHFAALEEALRPFCPPPRPLPALPKARTKPVVLGYRLHAYAGKALRIATAELAATAEGGRHRKLLAEARKLGSFAHHGVLTLAEITNSLSSACKANGLWKDEGGRLVRRTILDGYNYAANDGLRVPGGRTR